MKKPRKMVSKSRLRLTITAMATAAASGRFLMTESTFPDFSKVEWKKPSLSGVPSGRTI